MFRFRILCLLLVMCCMTGLCFPAAAAQVDSGSVYCFTQEDFSSQENFAGICITDLPQPSVGTAMLGFRVLRPGDILTAQQASQMTFQPLRTEVDTSAQIEYLPIYDDHVAASATMTIGIRGKEDSAPVAQDSAVETYKNLPATGKLKVTEPEGQAMTYTVTRQPRRGTVSINEDGSFTYTPKKNKVGVDSFVFTAADENGNVSREATVTVTILKPTDATQYTDTLGRDCRFAAEWMRQTGIFVGENLADNSCFCPDKEVTRGEFVAMLVKALDIPAEDTVTYTGYTDEIPQWLQPYLAAAMRSGITAGLEGGETFGAGQSITGAEVSVLLKNALNLAAAAADTGAQALLSGDLSADAQAVPEDADAPVWAAESLAAVEAAGISLDANAPLTREQAALILYQASRLAREASV